MNIFGPCAAESEEQLLRIAQKLKGTFQLSTFNFQLIFRAGVWKPRTSPDTFQGVGDIGLKWLQRVKQEFGLPVATEVSTPEQVQKALAAGIDYLWLGARTSANPILVQAIADEINQTTNDQRLTTLKGIFIKNPVNEDAALWIGNIKRLTTNDQRPVYAVHRGCNHQPCWAMAYQLRKELPEIPLLLDPSHMSGDASKVSELCRDASELQYDGLMIEVHDRPQEALSDAKQQITPDQLTAIFKPQSPKSDSPLDLLWLRKMMDEVDDVLWETVSKRMAVSRQIGEYKKANGIEVVQPTRFEEILTKRLAWAKNQNLSEESVRELMETLHRESIRQQQ